jgi:hypothetical protein
VVQSLDLAPILHQVAAHAGTFRGRQALLALVNDDNRGAELRAKTRVDRNQESRQQRRIRSLTTVDTGYFEAPLLTAVNVPMAENAAQATRQYELVEQAMLALSASGKVTNEPPRTRLREAALGLSYPPLYGAESNPYDTENLPQTDDDDFLHLNSLDDWSLEHVLQAEQVIQALLNVHNWATSNATQQWTPLLADLILGGAPKGRFHHLTDNYSIDQLESVHGEIRGSVQVARVRSITDPHGRMTFQFCL